MTTQLADLAQLVGGQLTGGAANAAAAQIAGTEIEDAAILRDVKSGEITFADDPRLAEQLAASAAAAAVVGRGFPDMQIPLVVVDDVRDAFATIVRHFRPQPVQHAPGVATTSNVAESASVAPSAHIGERVIIGDGASIGERTVIHAGVVIMEGVMIGDDCTIFPNVVIYDHSQIGNQVILHAGAVIGAYGFGYDTVDGQHQLSVQLGNVILEDRVEIGACSTVDRGTYGPTVIGEGTKVDNQVMVAHNCRIGRHNILCSQVGIAGSTTTGDYVVMAGQVGVRDHVHIGTAVRIGAQSGISNDIADGETVFGTPAISERRQLTLLSMTAKLPQMRKELKRLTKLVDELSSQDVGGEPVTREGTPEEAGDGEDASRDAA